MLLKCVVWRGKVKFKVRSLSGHGGPKGHCSTLSLTLALDGCGWTTPCPGHFSPETETRCPLYGRLDVSQDQSTDVENLAPPLDGSWTVQSLAGRRTD